MSVRHPWRLPLLLALSLGLGGCTDESTGVSVPAQGAPCAPLSQEPCACDGSGLPGTRACLPSGQGWGDCACDGVDVSGDVSTDSGPAPTSLPPGFRMVTPVTATGKLSSPNYRLKLQLGAPAPSEILSSPNYQLTLGTPSPIH